MSIFSKAKDTFKLQRDAKKVKQELKNIHVEAEEAGVLTVRIGADQEVVAVEFTEKAFQEIANGSITRERLSGIFVKTMNRALKKAQEIASQKMKGIWEQMNSLR